MSSLEFLTATSSSFSLPQDFSITDTATPAVVPTDSTADILFPTTTGAVLLIVNHPHLVPTPSTSSSSVPTPTTTSIAIKNLGSIQATPTAPVPVRSSPPIGPIIGGIVGGVCVLATALALVVLFRRRQSRNRAHPFDPAESEAQTSGSMLRTDSPMITQANGRASLLIEPERRTKAARRQEYLQDQVQQIQQELHDLQSSADTASVASSSSPRLGGVEADMRRMVEQMEIMKAQMERLQGQVQSEWAQGLSDEPPPGYDMAGG